MGILLIAALGLIHLLEAPEELEEATYLGLLFLANFGGAVVATTRMQILVDNHDLQPPHAETDTAIEGIGNEHARDPCNRRDRLAREQGSQPAE